jgi:hypothetical protein
MNVRKKGVLPKKIKKLQGMASKKKSENSKPSYRDSLDEVTVTAKAPTEAEKAGAKAFAESDNVNRAAAYAEAATAKGESNAREKAEKLKKDTAERLNLPKKANVYNSKKRNKSWINALKKAGYRK